MNTLMRRFAAGNGVRVTLGAGEPGLMPLLGGWGSGEDDGSPILGGGTSGAYSRLRKLQRDVRVGGGGGGSSGGGGGGGGPQGCVDADSWISTGVRAYEVCVGDLLTVVDPATLARGYGEVSYSVTKREIRWRVACANGVQLVCSESAPIPTDLGLRTPHELRGREVVTQVDGELERVRVVDVQCIGLGDVQHITCENACFLAGEIEGFYMLHHNIKFDPI